MGSSLQEGIQNATKEVNALYYRLAIKHKNLEMLITLHATDPEEKRRARIIKRIKRLTTKREDRLIIMFGIYIAESSSKLQAILRQDLWKLISQINSVKLLTYYWQRLQNKDLKFMLYQRILELFKQIDLVDDKNLQETLVIIFESYQKK